MFPSRQKQTEMTGNPSEKDSKENSPRTKTECLVTLGLYRGNCSTFRPNFTSDPFPLQIPPIGPVKERLLLDCGAVERERTEELVLSSQHLHENSTGKTQLIINVPAVNMNVPTKIKCLKRAGWERRCDLTSHSPAATRRVQV